MSRLWPVFLTAPNTEMKALNKAFLLLQDFEFSDDPPESHWLLLTSRALPETPPKATVPPLAEITGNGFANATFDDVNEFVRANEEKLKAVDVTPHNWLIIDRKGIESGTCLVAEQLYEYDETTDAGRLTGKFRAARLPYEAAWGMFCNLDIANMGFEEWVDEDAGVQEDGSWKWVGPFPVLSEGSKQWDREVNERREKAIKEMREVGHIE